MLNPKLRLNYSLGSPRTGILNQSIRNCLISISKVICPIGPCPPLKERNLTTTNPIFGLVQLPSFCSLLPIKVFHLFFFFFTSFILYSSSELLTINYSGQCSIHESLEKTNKIIKIYSVEFCFLI